MLGMAIAAMIRIIVTTMRSSIREKPRGATRPVRSHTSLVVESIGRFSVSGPAGTSQEKGQSFLPARLQRASLLYRSQRLGDQPACNCWCGTLSVITDDTGRVGAETALTRRSLCLGHCGDGVAIDRASHTAGRNACCGPDGCASAQRERITTLFALCQDAVKILSVRTAHRRSSGSTDLCESYRKAVAIARVK